LGLSQVLVLAQPHPAKFHQTIESGNGRGGGPTPIAADGPPPFRADHNGRLLRPPELEHAYRDVLARIDEGRFRRCGRRARGC
jgi:hypothetical protein